MARSAGVPMSGLEQALMRVFREMPEVCVSLNIWRDRANCWISIDSRQEDLSHGDHEGAGPEEALEGALAALERPNA